MTMATLQSRDPATGEQVWSGAAASAADVDRAFAAARAAAESWGALAFGEREAFARRFARELESDKEPMAEAIARETGKVLWDARGEVTAMLNKVDISARAFQARTGVTETAAAGAVNALRHKPPIAAGDR